MRTLTLKSERGVHDVELEYARDGYVFHHGGAARAAGASAPSTARSCGIRFGGRTLVADVVRYGDELHVFTRRPSSRADAVRRDRAVERRRRRRLAA